MIKLLNLKLKNFMNISEAEIDFSTDRFVILQGNNGQGKSAIPESLAFCFLEHKRGDSYRDYIKTGETTAEIHLRAEYGCFPILFDISITSKPGYPPTTKHIEFKDTSYDNSECSTLLNSFGIDYLSNIMFSLQGADNFTSLRPFERAALLKRVTNFEFTEQLDSVRKILARLIEDSLSYKAQLELLQSSKKSYTEDAKIPELDVKEVEKLENNLNLLNSELRNLLTNNNSIFNLNKKTTLLNTINNTESLLNRNKKDLTELHVSLNTDISKKQLYLDKLSSLADPHKHEERLTELTIYLESLKAELKGSVESLKKIESEVTTNKLKLDTLTKQVEVNKTGVCPHCDSELTRENLDRLEKSLQKSLNDFNKLLDSSKKQESELSLNITKLEKQIFQTNKSISDISSEILMISKEKKSLEDFIEHIEQSINSRKSHIDSYKSKITSLEQTLYNESRELQELEELILSSPNDLAKIENLEKQIESISNILQKNRVNLEINLQTDLYNKSMRKKKEEDESLYNTIETNYSKTLTDIEDYKEVIRILEIELPNFIIVKTCSKLESLINGFISRINPDMRVKLLQKKNGVEFYYIPNIREFEKTKDISKLENWLSTKMTSAFEKELLNIAWRVALAKAYNLDILLLDEVDASSSIENSNRVFQEISNLGFSQLLIITHKPQVIDILKEKHKVTLYTVENGEFILS